MTGDAFERAQNRWNDLRARLHEANRAKAHGSIVSICDEIIVFSAANPAVQVVDFLIDKRAAKALAGLERFAEAAARIDRAILTCKRYSAANAGSFASEVTVMEKLRDRWRKRGAPGGEESRVQVIAVRKPGP